MTYSWVLMLVKSKVEPSILPQMNWP